MIGLMTKKSHLRRVRLLQHEIHKLKQEIELDNYLIHLKNKQIKQLEEPRIDLEYEEIQSMLATLVAGYYEQFFIF